MTEIYSDPELNYAEISGNLLRNFSGSIGSTMSNSSGYSTFSKPVSRSTNTSSKLFNPAAAKNLQISKSVGDLYYLSSQDKIEPISRTISKSASDIQNIQVQENIYQNISFSGYSDQLRPNNISRKNLLKTISNQEESNHPSYNVVLPVGPLLNSVGKNIVFPSVHSQTRSKHVNLHRPAVQSFRNHSMSPDAHEVNLTTNQAKYPAAYGVNSTTNPAKYLATHGANSTTNPAKYPATHGVNSTTNPAKSPSTHGANSTTNPANYTATYGVNSQSNQSWTKDPHRENSYNMPIKSLEKSAQQSNGNHSVVSEILNIRSFYKNTGLLLSNNSSKSSPVQKRAFRKSTLGIMSSKSQTTDFNRTRDISEKGKSFPGSKKISSEISSPTLAVHRLNRDIPTVRIPGDTPTQRVPGDTSALRVPRETPSLRVLGDKPSLNSSSAENIPKQVQPVRNTIQVYKSKPAISLSNWLDTFYSKDYDGSKINPGGMGSTQASHQYQQSAKNESTSSLLAGKDYDENISLQLDETDIRKLQILMECKR